MSAQKPFFGNKKLYFSLINHLFQILFVLMNRKRLQDELRRIMYDVFPCLETELVELVNFGHKLDSLWVNNIAIKF